MITFEPVTGTNGTQHKILLEGEQVGLVDENSGPYLCTAEGGMVRAKIDDLHSIIDRIRVARSHWGMVKIGQS